MSWGTEAFHSDKTAQQFAKDELIHFVDTQLKEAGKVSDGDHIVISITEPANLVDDTEVVIDHIVC